MTIQEQKQEIEHLNKAIISKGLERDYNKSFNPARVKELNHEIHLLCKRRTDLKKRLGIPVVPYYCHY